jgi:hypothetical protein
MMGFVNGLLCPPVLKIYPAYEDRYYQTPGSYTFVAPRGAKRIDVTCIGGGGAGGRTGVDYGQGGTPGTGGTGGTGSIAHKTGYAVTAGLEFAIRVGAGGTLQSAAGASVFGNLVRADGGENGADGAASDLTNDPNAVVAGGNGGTGGIGGEKGDSGTNRAGKDWGGGIDGADRAVWSGWSDAEWYCFKDKGTQKRLGNAGDDHSAVGYSPRGRTDLPGVRNGQGGQGTRKHPGVTRTDGGNGLVAVRIWYQEAQ